MTKNNENKKKRKTNTLAHSLARSLVPTSAPQLAGQRLTVFYWQKNIYKINCPIVMAYDSWVCTNVRGTCIKYQCQSQQRNRFPSYIWLESQFGFNWLEFILRWVFSAKRKYVIFIGYSFPTSRARTPRHQFRFYILFVKFIVPSTSSSATNNNSEREFFQSHTVDMYSRNHDTTQFRIFGQSSLIGYSRWRAVHWFRVANKLRENKK